MTILRQVPLVERFREANSPYLSPIKVGDFFGFSNRELAERAHVHPTIPASRPQASTLQKYLRDLLRVLAASTEMTGDMDRAAFLMRNEQVRIFGYKTADVLIQEGKADAVIAYLESIAGGAAG